MLIDAYFKKSEAAKETQYCTHRTDGVAPRPPVPPGQKANQQKGNGRDNERADADQRGIYSVKGIVVET